MPSIENHKMKYKKNKEFIRYIKSSPVEYDDWEITAVFYAGLHKISAYLHSYYNVDDKVICSHDDMKSYLESITRYDLKRTYSKLLKMSHTARYDFENMHDRVSVAHDYLTQLINGCTTP